MKNKNICCCMISIVYIVAVIFFLLTGCKLLSKLYECQNLVYIICVSVLIATNIICFTIITIKLLKYCTEKDKVKETNLLIDVVKETIEIKKQIDVNNEKNINNH